MRLDLKILPKIKRNIVKDRKRGEINTYSKLPKSQQLSRSKEFINESCMLQTHEKRLRKCCKAPTIPAHSQIIQQHTGSWNPDSTTQWPPSSCLKMLRILSVLGQASQAWPSLPLQTSWVSDSLLFKICAFTFLLWTQYMPKVQSNCVTRVFALCLSQHLLQLLPSVIPMC